MGVVEGEPRFRELSESMAKRLMRDVDNTVYLPGGRTLKWDF